MMARRFIAALVLTFAGLLFSALAHAAPVTHFKPSKSDANIHAIGRRNLASGPDFYSLQHEQTLGKELARQISHSAAFVNDPAVKQYIDQIGQMIARHSDVRMPVTFYVIDSDEISAFTLPGGYQYVTRGLLLQLNSEAELAGVLAHGIASTALRSATKEATQADIAQMAAIPAPVFVPNGWPQGVGGTNVMLPLSALNLNVKRYYELEADYFGLQYVYVTGYDPESYVNLLERISPKTASPIASPLSSSPPLAEQVALMQKEIADILPKQSSAIVSTPAFAEFQQRLRAWKRANPAQKH